MILSFRDLFKESTKRTRIKAEITTSYGQPLIVLPDGGPLDLLLWVSLDYQVVRANKKETEELVRLGLLE